MTTLKRLQYKNNVTVFTRRATRRSILTPQTAQGSTSTCYIDTTVTYLVQQYKQYGETEHYCKKKQLMEITGGKIYWYELVPATARQGFTVSQLCVLVSDS